MYDYDKLDVNEYAFVLDQKHAIEYLKHLVNNTFDYAIDGRLGEGYGVDVETASEDAKDLMAMAQQIIDNKWEDVKFESNNGMSSTGISVFECRTYLQPYTEDTLKFAEKTLTEMDALNNKIGECRTRGLGYLVSKERDDFTITHACEVIEQLIDIIKGTEK